MTTLTQPAATEVTNFASFDLSALRADQLLMQLVAYNEYEDTYTVHIDDGSPSTGQRCSVPALLLPMLIGEYGESDELLGRAFILTQPHA